MRLNMAKCECHLLVIWLLGLALSLDGDNTYPATWKCLYKDFPVDVEKMKGAWWVYACNPMRSRECYFKEHLYWTRITMTDYISHAVELHCSMPWMRQRMMIYTRAKEPTNETLTAIQSYLRTVLLTFRNFTIRKKPKDCEKDQVRQMQRWHVPKYMSQDFHPHYIKPLVVNENI
ncbi:uncharacterized protein Dana_GF10792, isoform B [Drosophila ananassae]|uniref:Uncharacterized protein, isoform B n=1 Tax=Drosophila ananassae TaxID=7217 RepID=A0A0P8XVY7_DROAN|nr:uncharacterized protein LOC6493659 isoform X2 [Drosophila ananassae]KPU78870.1 uncharacterized protein Dana_GF10792, isoform B [Drosophila ananassae]